MRKLIIKIYETSHAWGGGKIIERVYYIIRESQIKDKKPYNNPIQGRCY